MTRTSATPPAPSPAWAAPPAAPSSAASADPLASWLGSVNVALPGEGWPTSAARPMMPLCQFNMAEMPFRLESLNDVAFPTVFIDQEEVPLSTPNGEGCLLRAYPTLEGLVAVEPPADRGLIKPFPVR